MLLRPQRYWPASDLADVVGQQAPTDATFHARFTAVTTASQPESAFEDADAALDTRSPAIRASKGGAIADAFLFGRQ
jgi:hypothetical protein